MPPSLCTVSGTVLDAAGSPQAVAVSARPATGDRTNMTGDEQMTSGSVSTTSSAVDGTWSLNVVPSAYAGGLKFQFTIDGHEGPAVTVPSLASANLADLEA